MFVEGRPFQLGRWKANGFSVGSKVSFLAVPALDLILDVGWAVDAMRPLTRCFVSHLHIDHALGLPVWLGWHQSDDPDAEPPKVYVRADVVDRAKALIAGFEAAQDWPLRCELIGLREGDSVRLDETRRFEVFETPHYLPTMGLTVHERRRRLTAAFQGADKDRIRAAIAAGEEVYEWPEVPILSYTSDTTPELFERRPDLLDSEVLVTECTYLDGVLEWDPDDDSHAGEKRATHCHVRPLARALRGFRGQHLVLGHLNAKYTLCDMTAFLMPRFPPELRARLSTLPCAAEAPALEQPPGPMPRGLPDQGDDAAADRRQAFEDALVAFLTRQPELREWIVSRYAEVTTPHPGADGLDPAGLDPEDPLELMPVLLRRAIVRCGTWFRGTRRLIIGDQRSPGLALNPGRLPASGMALPTTPARRRGPLRQAWPGSLADAWVYAREQA